MFAIRDGERVRLISRSGVDWTCAFPIIVAAVETLAVRNCLIDGEVIMRGGDGLALAPKPPAGVAVTFAGYCLDGAMDQAIISADLEGFRAGQSGVHRIRGLMLP
jgi:hypothetical protein